VTAPQSGGIEVEDQLERRIRKPVDLVRCALACIEIVVPAVAGVAASATTSGVETDIVDASHRLPDALLVVAPPLALSACSYCPWPWPSSGSSGASSGVQVRQCGFDSLARCGVDDQLLFLSHGISSRVCHPRATTCGSQNQIGRSETGHHRRG
jgi:hypothetical protein